MKVYDTGLSGEEMAQRYLESQGYQLIARRWRGQDGELDLIMQDGAYLVFVEVKYRPNGGRGAGLQAVTSAKQRRMMHAALAFLAEREWMEHPVRFDVVEITREGLRHVPNAFQSAG